MENGFSRPYCTRDENVELAKVVLKRILADPKVMDYGVPVKTALLIGKDHGLVKSVMKEARKELGIQSESKNGEQYWLLPREIREEHR